MEKKGTNWGWIIFWLIIFWPVGLVLVVKKLAIDKSALMSVKTRSLSVIGWILTIFGGIALFAFISEPEPDMAGYIVVSLLFLAGGILLLHMASKTKKTAAKYKKYIEIVINQNIQSIEKIAYAMALSYDIVSKDLQNMIDIGYLRGAYIHQANREIILRSPVPVRAQDGISFSEQASPQDTVMTCLSCGAKNVIAVGRVSECEYCGTPIVTHNV